MYYLYLISYHTLALLVKRVVTENEPNNTSMTFIILLQHNLFVQFI